MKNRPFLSVLAVAAALVATSAASAGGSFEQIVGVGANGGSRVIELRQGGPRSEAVLNGAAVRVPRGGFVRIYPMIGALPGDPGRYYPALHVLCLYWHEPASNCMRLAAAGIKLLSRFTKLSLRHQAPTAVVGVSYHSRLLRHANGNIFAGLELALERPPVRQLSPPRYVVRLTVRWRGPRASRMPTVVWLAPHGVYKPHRLFQLPRGSWCYLALNLPHAPAALTEATNRICH